MNDVMLLTGDEARELGEHLASARFGARVWVDEDRLKVSVDRQSWTFGVGSWATRPRPRRTPTARSWLSGSGSHDYQGDLDA